MPHVVLLLLLLHEIGTAASIRSNRRCCFISYWKQWISRRKVWSYLREHFQLCSGAALFSCLLIGLKLQRQLARTALNFVKVTECEKKPVLVTLLVDNNAFTFVLPVCRQAAVSFYTGTRKVVSHLFCLMVGLLYALHGRRKWKSISSSRPSYLLLFLLFFISMMGTMK